MDVSPSCGPPGPRPADSQPIQVNLIYTAFAVMFQDLLTARIGGTARGCHQQTGHSPRPAGAVRVRRLHGRRDRVPGAVTGILACGVQRSPVPMHLIEAEEQLRQ